LEQRELYGRRFGLFTEAFNKGQGGGLASVDAARKVIALAEQVPAPIRAAVGKDAEKVLRIVREKSEAEVDAFRLQLLGLD
jgi:hypothetical protein